MLEYSMDKTDCTWKNAFLWGNFRFHCEAAKKGSLGNRIIHALIAAAEFLPIMGQITSIFEKIIVTHCSQEKRSTTDLSDKKISTEKPAIGEKVPSPILEKKPEKQTNSSPETSKKLEKPTPKILKNPVKKSSPNSVVSEPTYNKRENEDKMAYRKRIYADTLKACEHGYINNKKEYVEISHEPMILGTASYQEILPLPPAEKIYKTAFSVIEKDTFQVLLDRIADGAIHPVGINMANSLTAGGGVEDGCSAQEEALSRCSNLVRGLKTQPYPLHLYGGIYCPHVQVFREAEKLGFSFLDKPQDVALVSVAAFDLREIPSDRTYLKLPENGNLSIDTLNNCKKYIDETRKKICNMLRMMAFQGHKELVLGALGCGAFLNPPEVVSTIFKDIFESPEFKGRFERVDFAILRLSDTDQNNIDKFSQICTSLNQ